jgi:hypothetical protein
MKNYFKLTFVMLVVCASLVSMALPALASPSALEGEITGKMDLLAIEMGQDPDAAESLEVSIGKVIKLALSFLGVILVIIMIYAGFLWMTAGGNEDQVKKAKEWMKNGIIGLVIVLAAYAISDFALTTILDATGA